MSGSPGTGKTTIARELAQRSPWGVHIVSDEFYYFIAHLLAPSEPASEAQNATVITAAARATAAYAEGGYDVTLDGVFGPWVLPLIARELRPTGFDVDLIVLRASLDESLRRVADRNAPEMEGIVRRMHGRFSDLGPLERHVVDTQDRPVEETLAEIAKRQEMRDFHFDLEGVS